MRSNVEAIEMDEKDSLNCLRDHFYLPSNTIYFATHCLGLQPKSALDAISKELTTWQQYGFRGYFSGEESWLDYHKPIQTMLAEIVGAKPIEVAIMNSLSVNLHLMLSTFYQPTSKRYKILIEENIFPSDLFAIQSQIKRHNLLLSDCLIKIKPRNETGLLDTSDITTAIERHSNEIAMIFLGSPNFKTGQVMDIPLITKIGHEHGCIVGFDIAHGIGNVVLNLHDWNVDFAVWSSYKYLNAGPGSVGGCFIHEHFAHNKSLPRLEGWWGHDQAKRFNMNEIVDFDPSPGADGWQLSAPPLFSLAMLRASLEIFQKVGMAKLREKSIRLNTYLLQLLAPLSDYKTITPTDPEKHGCQTTILYKQDAQGLQNWLTSHNIITGSHSDNIIRISISPLYNTFSEINQFAKKLDEYKTQR